MWIEWRRMERDGLHAAQRSVEPLFERTQRFRAYSSWIVPGLLQTEGYTRRMLRGAQQRRMLPDDVDKALAARMERQRVLTEGNRVFAFLLEESTLHATSCDAATMTEQLHHLTELAKRPNVGIGVIPATVDRAHRPVEDFWIFDDAQVNVELVSGYLTVTAPSEIKQYAQAFAELAGIAVHGQSMRRLVNQSVQALA